MFSFTRRALLACAAAAACLPAIAADTAAWPDKPVRLVVPYTPGGATDIVARLIAQKVTDDTKWTFIVDNRAGGNGNIGIDVVAKAKPDGYTIGLGQTANLAINPTLFPKMPYDALKDVVAVSIVAAQPVVLVVRTDAPFKTLADVVAAAKAAPDSITYGSPGNGTTIHLAGEIFNSAANIKLRHVPYKGSNPAMMDVLAGNVDLMVSSLPSAIAQIKSGKLRPLAVTSARRSTSLPDIPTVAELGYKDFDVSTWYGLFMPAATPKEIVATVNAEVNKLLATNDMKAAIHAQGAEVQNMTSEQFSTLLKTDYQKWKGIVQASGATIE